MSKTNKISKIRGDFFGEGGGEFTANACQRPSSAFLTETAFNFDTIVVSCLFSERRYHGYPHCCCCDGSPGPRAATGPDPPAAPPTAAAAPCRRPPARPVAAVVEFGTGLLRPPVCHWTSWTCCRMPYCVLYVDRAPTGREISPSFSLLFFGFHFAVCEFWNFNSFANFLCNIDLRGLWKPQWTRFRCLRYFPLAYVRCDSH